MSIKGLSEKRRLIRLGKIRLGVKKDNGKGVEYPHAEDHFVCPPEVQAVYGEEPTDLDIMFPSNDLDMVARQEYKYYTKSRKNPICRGNGESAFQLTDLDTGAIVTKDSKQIEMRKVGCGGRKECPYYGNCREVLNLQFLLPKVPGVGVWQLDSGSINSIINVNSDLDLIARLCGTIVGIPLKLRLCQQEAEVEGKRKNIYVLHIVYEGTLSQVLQEGNFRSLRLAAPLEVPEPEEVGEDLQFPKGTPDLSAPSEGVVTSAGVPADKEWEALQAAGGEKQKVKPEGKEQMAWEKLGFASAAEQLELRTKLFKMTVEDLFAKEQVPAQVAAEWLSTMAGIHKFTFSNTSVSTREEIVILIQEAGELLEAKKSGLIK